MPREPAAVSYRVSRTRMPRDPDAVSYRVSRPRMPRDPDAISRPRISPQTFSLSVSAEPMAWTSSWTLRDSGLPLNVRPSTAQAFSSEDRRRQQRTLSAAAMSGDLDLVQSLLSGRNKADPSQPGPNGLTPLHMVCFSSRSAFAQPGSPEAEAADEVAPLNHNHAAWPRPRT